MYTDDTSTDDECHDIQNEHPLILVTYKQSHLLLVFRAGTCPSKHRQMAGTYLQESM